MIIIRICSFILGISFFSAQAQTQHAFNIIREEIMIPMRDGIKLGAILYRPDSKEKFPAVEDWRKSDPSTKRVRFANPQPFPSLVFPKNVPLLRITFGAESRFPTDNVGASRSRNRVMLDDDLRFA